MTDLSGQTTLVLTGATAALVVATAYRLRSLSLDGTIGAIVVGGVALAAGPGWAALLLVYFVSSTALSRVGRAAKARRTASVIAKGGQRDLWQVMANGGVFALAALWSVVAGEAPWGATTPDSVWGAAAAGALAASAADTWATEIGTWLGGTPRHLLTWRPLAPGLSGGVSAAGTLAMAGGACAMALVAEGVGVGGPWVWIACAGIAGAMADSLVGATLQGRRVCTACGATTEQVVHACGGATRAVGGLPWLGNDAVNALATVTGAAVAVWSVRSTA